MIVGATVTTVTALSRPSSPSTESITDALRMRAAAR